MPKTLHEFVNERIGVGGVGTSNEVAEYVKQSIKQIMDTYQLNKMVDAVTRLAAEQQASDASAPAADPAASLKALGFNLSEFVQVLQRLNERLEAALEKERSAHLDTRIALAKHAADERRVEVERDTTLAKLLVDLVKDKDSHSTRELVEAIRQELREARQQVNPRPDPVTESILKPVSESLAALVRQRLDERQQLSPSPAQVLKESLQTVREIQSLLPQPPPKDDEHKWRVREKQLEVLERKAERELQVRRETQEMWAGVIEKVVDAVSKGIDRLFGSEAASAQAAPASTAAPAAPALSAPVPSNGVAPGPEVGMICPRCGTQFLPPRRAAFSCPNCRLSFVRSAPVAENGEET